MKKDMERYTSNIQTAAAKFIKSTGKVNFVSYAGLEGDKYHELAKKYLPLGICGVISFSIKGGRDTAVKFMDSLMLASNTVHKKIPFANHIREGYLYYVTRLRNYSSTAITN